MGVTESLPGHEDFSEDTYRTLTAVDSAVMVIDAAKGIEAQTRKLFEVCRRFGWDLFWLGETQELGRGQACSQRWTAACSWGRKTSTTSQTRGRLIPR